METLLTVVIWAAIGGVALFGVGVALTGLFNVLALVVAVVYHAYLALFGRS